MENIYGWIYYKYNILVVVTMTWVIPILWFVCVCVCGSVWEYECRFYRFYSLTGIPAGRKRPKLCTGIMKQSRSSVDNDIGSFRVPTTMLLPCPLKLTIPSSRTHITTFRRNTIQTSNLIQKRKKEQSTHETDINRRKNNNNNKRIEKYEKMERKD